MEEIKGVGYLELQQLSVVENLSSECDSLSLICEVNYGEKKVRIQVDKPFFISENIQYETGTPVIIRESKIYISQNMTEELFSELNIPLKYRFTAGELLIDYQKKRSTFESRLEFIVIDPGHGGKDPGAFGINEVAEKDIVLSVSRYLFFSLKKRFPDINIFITRFNDEFISLGDRSIIANRKLNNHNFGIFISLHCNATFQKKIHGYELFYLAQNSSNEEARQVMLMENNLVEGTRDIMGLESTLIDSQIISESKVLARQFDAAFMDIIGDRVISRGVRSADFAVLRETLLPSILVEMGYISNSREAMVLQSEEYKRLLSDAIGKGIDNFIANRPGIR